MQVQKKITKQQIYPYLLAICGAIGLIASFTLVLEKIHVLSDPNYSPICNINPIFSCQSVSDTPQGEVFNFPNQFIGLIGFSIVVTVGMALLAGAKFKRWFWLGLQTGLTLGFVFMLWLMHQSIYVIGALCIYCMITWSVMIPLFWYTTLHNLDTKVFKYSTKYNKFVDFIQKHHFDILICIYLVVIVMILNRFWYYFSTLI